MTVPQPGDNPERRDIDQDGVEAEYRVQFNPNGVAVDATAGDLNPETTGAVALLCLYYEIVETAFNGDEVAALVELQTAAQKVSFETRLGDAARKEVTVEELLTYDTDRDE